jgi:hypothetical protein
VGVDIDKARCKRKAAGIDGCRGDVLKGWSNVADAIAAKGDIEDFGRGAAAIDDRGISD